MPDDVPPATPGSYYDAGAHCAAAAAEASSFWARGRNELVLRLLARHFPEARSVLDVGCGTGIVLDALHRARPELELTGVDPFGPALAEAGRRVPAARLLERGAEELALEERFDVALVLDVLEHLDDDRAALHAAHDVLRPGGGLLVAVPQHRWLWSAADDWAEHRRRYRRGELLASLAACGFEVVRTTSFVSLLLPPMAAARLLGRRGGYDPVAELSPSAAVDRALGAVLRLEVAAIARGASLPAGGSLVAVARRRS